MLKTHSMLGAVLPINISKIELGLVSRPPMDRKFFYSCNVGTTEKLRPIIGTENLNTEWFNALLCRHFQTLLNFVLTSSENL